MLLQELNSNSLINNAVAKGFNFDEIIKPFIEMYENIIFTSKELIIDFINYFKASINDSKIVDIKVINKYIEESNKKKE